MRRRVLTCYVGKCERPALWRVDDSQSGKLWLMCELHKNGFNRKPMIVRGRI